MRSISRYSSAFPFFCSVLQLFIQQLRETGGGGDGVHFRPHVSNPSFFPLFLPRSRCKQGKDTRPFSLSISRSRFFFHPPFFLPSPRVSSFSSLFTRPSQPHFFPFPPFFSFFFFFVATSTNLRRILVSAFLAVFPFPSLPRHRHHHHHHRRPTI